jgi:transcriptional regulator with XRE-family HTH domain
MDEKNLISIAKRIEDLRKNSGLSKKEFAEKWGKDCSKLEKIETGYLLPTVSDLLKLSDFLDISYDYLMTGRASKGQIPDFGEHTETVEQMLTDMKNVPPLFHIVSGHYLVQKLVVTKINESREAEES